MINKDLLLPSFVGTEYVLLYHSQFYFPLQYFVGILVIAMVTELPEIINGVQFSLENNVNLG